MKDGDYSLDAVSSEEIFEEARDRLELAMEAEADDRSHAKADLLFREGRDQWDTTRATSASQESPEVTINLTDAMVTRVINNMKQQRPRGKCHPVGDGADIEVAEVINGIGRHIEYRSEASVAYDTAGESAVVAGWGFVRIIAEYVSPDSFDQDLRILPIRNIFTVYMDPSAVMPTGCDQKWCLISIVQKKSEYKRLNPGYKDIDWKESGGDKWDNREEIRLAEYFRIRERAAKLYLIGDQMGNRTATFDKPKDPELLKLSGQFIADERGSSRKAVEWFMLNGKEVTQRATLPGEWIPVVRCEGNAVDIDGKVMRRGMVRSMRDPQKMVNYAEASKIRRLGLAPKTPWVAAEGQLDGHPEWDDANERPYSVLTYKPVTIETGQGAVLLPAPMRQPPAQIEAGFTELAQQMRANLMTVAGQPNEPGQDAQGQVVSGQAIKRRQGLSDQSHFQYYDKQTLAIAQIWRTMLQWIPVYYSEQRMQRIIGEDGMPSMVMLNQPTEENGVAKVKNDLSVGRYDVVMDTGPGYDTKREENADNMIALMSSQVIAEIVAKVAPDLIFRGLDYPYAQDIADRLAAQTPDGLKKLMDGMSGQAKSVINSLYAQLQATQKELQQAQQEAKFGMAKAHLQAVTKAHDTEESNKTKRLDTETKADTARFDTLTKAHTALHIEEIKAGASLLNTHVEAEHNRKAAELVLESAESAEGSKS